MFKHWLCLLFFCFCAGDLLAFYERQHLFRLLLAAVVTGSLFYILFRIRRMEKAALSDKDNINHMLCLLFSVVIFAGGFMAANGKIKMQKNWQALTGKHLTLQGSVEPDSLRKKEEGISAIVAAEYPLRGKVRIFVKTEGKNTDLIAQKMISGKVRLAGTLREEVFLQNPGTYNGYLHSKVKGIYGKMTLAPGQLKITEEPLPLPLRFTAAAQSFRTQALAYLHKRESAVLTGMVLGGYQAVDPVEADVFRDNGMAHLLAVSGAHVAVLAVFLQTLLNPLGKWRIYIIQVLLFLYALLCGLQPSVLRAVLMGCVLLWGKEQKLRADRLNLLLLTAWGLLFVNPFWLLDIGFQLSFATTAGLLLAGEKVSARVPQGLPDWLRGILGITLTAQIFSFPFSVYYFHRVSLIGMLSNLLLLPALEAAVLLFLSALLVLFAVSAVKAIFTVAGVGVMIGVFRLADGGLIHIASGIGQGLLAAAEFLLHGAVAAGGLLAKLPFAAVDVADCGWIGIFCYCGFAAAFFDLGFFVRFSSRQRRSWLLSMFCIFLILCGVRYFKPKELTVYFIDVGQGDSALVRTPAGKNILIDTGGLLGGADIARMVLLPSLRYLGVKQIDALCLSHGDHDHAGGAAGVAAKLPVKNIFLGADAERSADVQTLLKAAGNTANVYRLQKGEQWNVGDCKIVVASASGRNVSVASPSSAVTEENASSLVLQLFCSGYSLVFTGDADMDTEENAMPLLCYADILKVSHHGSDTSSSPHFLDRIRPRYAVISCGKHNRYGHPGKSTLERLASRHIIPLRTDQLGAIKIVFEKNTMRWYSYRYHENQF